MIRECSNHKKFKILLSSFNIIEGRRFVDDLLDPSAGRPFTDAVVAVVSDIYSLLAALMIFAISLSLILSSVKRRQMTPPPSNGVLSTGLGALKALTPR
jgi:hypothetical protein